MYLVTDCMFISIDTWLVAHATPLANLLTYSSGIAYLKALYKQNNSKTMFTMTEMVPINSLL